MASDKDYSLFYSFAMCLMQETVSKPNFLSFLIHSSFENKEIISVSINEREESIDWEYALWDSEKDYELYFSNESAIAQYRYQILKPNPTIFFAKGVLPKEVYIYTLALLKDKKYPLSEKKPGIGIDGTTYTLDFPNIQKYEWWCDLPDSYSTFR